MRASIALLISNALTANFALAQDEAVTLTSPDERMTVEISITHYGEPQYTVRYDDEVAIEPSKLGIRFAEQARFEDDLTIADTARSSHDDTWEQPWGERRVVRDQYEELLVTFEEEETGRSFDVRFRAFDDGLGFRYEFGRPSGLRGEVVITDELTEFTIPQADTTAFHIPARMWNRYEYLYETTGLDGIHTVHTPVTFVMEGGQHLSIHEAALTDYSGMSLTLKRNNVLEADLAPHSQGGKVHKRGGFETPWRVVQVAPDAEGLVNGTDIYLNLNEPNRLGDVSWVEPGKYVGIWWGMHLKTQTWGSGPDHGATTENTKEMIDFAAENGFAGVLVEGWNIGWDDDWFNAGEVMDFTKAYRDFNLKEVADYAAEKGVRLIGHHETSGHVKNYEEQMEAAYDLYEKHGVRQVKTGYVADAGDLVFEGPDGIEVMEYHDSQANANHHVRALKEAAERKISLNAHEPVKDTGLRRTYPNAISREGARGMEYSAWGVPPNVPEHTVIIPFTRLLSGPMDYTPGIFDLKPNEGPDGERLTENSTESYVATTLAKQLALYVTIYSPIQMAADLPENYEARPDAFQFIKDVPTDWEESIALDAAVGDYLVVARQERGTDEWFMGAITDEEARQISVPLDFLEEGVTYRAEVYRDGESADYETNPYPIVIEDIEVTATETIDLDLAPGGGTAVRFVPLG